MEDRIVILPEISKKLPLWNVSQWLSLNVCGLKSKHKMIQRMTQWHEIQRLQLTDFGDWLCLKHRFRSETIWCWNMNKHMEIWISGVANFEILLSSFTLLCSLHMKWSQKWPRVAFSLAGRVLSVVVNLLRHNSQAWVRCGEECLDRLEPPSLALKSYVWKLLTQSINKANALKYLSGCKSIFANYLNIPRPCKE